MRGVAQALCSELDEITTKDDQYCFRSVRESFLKFAWLQLSSSPTMADYSPNILLL